LKFYECLGCPANDFKANSKATNVSRAPIKNGAPGKTRGAFSEVKYENK